jgi:dTDP-4-dehydrorhamnose reductase
MKYAIFGSAGQVGQEFCKLLPAEQLILLTRTDADISDADSVQGCVKRLDCDVLVNAAAFHDVNGCEDSPEKAFKVNAIGAMNVAQAARKRGLTVVFFSSDYVFGQETHRSTPYLESDRPGPLNAYGVSKVAGEELVRTTTDEHLIVRTSSLFGVVTSRKGWTFPEMILRRARAGEPMRVVNDQHMSPTYTLDLVRTVVDLVEANARGTVHVTNGGGCTWYDFAAETLKLAGLEYPIAPVDSSSFPAKARRPTYSQMASERIGPLGVAVPRDWRDAIAAYLTEKGERP